MDTRKKNPQPASGTPAGPKALVASSRRDEQLDKDADVSPEERTLLARSASNPPDEDERAIHEASLDETDEDGTPLEEKGLDQDLSGGDLDMPAAGEDDEDEDNYDD